MLNTKYLSMTHRCKYYQRSVGNGFIDRATIHPRRRCKGKVSLKEGIWDKSSITIFIYHIYHFCDGLAPPNVPMLACGCWMCR